MVFYLVLLISNLCRSRLAAHPEARHASHGVTGTFRVFGLSEHRIMNHPHGSRTDTQMISYLTGRKLRRCVGLQRVLAFNSLHQPGRINRAAIGNRGNHHRYLQRRSGDSSLPNGQVCRVAIGPS